jgi:SAM-dependent methyltransferase
MLDDVRAKFQSWLANLGLGVKGREELAYWRSRAEVEGTLNNNHFEALYTEMFGLARQFYDGKRVLDIGCGPRGSLEWATKAAERVGLDPLVDQYRTLGIDRHGMRYVSASAESIPFPNGYFDVVTSLNSLDHVDDPRTAMREIARVVRPTGTFLLEVEVGHSPTPTEPISLWFDILDDLAPYFTVVFERRYEMPPGRQDVHAAYQSGTPFDMSGGRHAGVLVAQLHRKPLAAVS